jgi:putative flippase GtrA
MIVETVCRKQQKASHQFLRFLIVGGSSAATYVVACTTLAYLFFEYRAAISVAVHCALIPITFFFQRHVTFRSSGAFAKQFLGYFTLQAFSISVSTALLARFLTDRPYLNAVTYLTIAGLAAIVSFAVCKFLVFEHFIIDNGGDKKTSI